MRYTDLSGTRFAHLVVLSRADDRKGMFWLCRCDCGRETIVSASHLKTGHTTSCGCARHRSGRDSPTFKHGFDGQDRLYRIWNNMRDRCYCKASSSYDLYGARGINVCEEWDDFLNFKDWALKNGYEAGLSIDRIDNNGPYAPWNCRWADAKTQALNRNNKRLIEYKGVSDNLMNWAE